MMQKKQANLNIKIGRSPFSVYLTIGSTVDYANILGWGSYSSSPNNRRPVPSLQLAP
jgi:hypothetical protein